MDGFDEFFVANYGSVLRAVRLLVADREGAEDLTQEAFARACRRWRAVSRMDRPVAWVYVVALNERRRQWRRERSIVSPADAPSSDEEGAVLTAIRVRELLETLPPRQRAAVVLRYLSDLPVRDVATVMHCAEGTVKATLHRALVSLRLTIEDDDAD